MKMNSWLVSVDNLRVPQRDTPTVFSENAVNIKLINDT